MTDATPEIRITLLSWAARLGPEFQSGTLEVLAHHLGVPKRFLGEALEYLVNEGYLWKIKSPLEPLEGDRRKIRFDYCLTPEAWRMWCDWLSEQCIWQDEIHFVLRLQQSAKEASSTKGARITVQMRLAWVALLMTANRAGYVVCRESSKLTKMLGMTEEQFRRAIKALSREGILSVTLSALGRTEIFGPIPSIYKLVPQSPTRKVIKIGADLQDSIFAFKHFLAQLNTFYLKVIRSKKKPDGRLTNPYLPDEQYFALASIFQNQRLTALVTKACESIIFSIGSEWASQPHSMAQEQTSEVKNAESEALRAKVHAQLQDLLFSSKEGCSEKQSAEMATDAGIGTTLAAKLQDFTLWQLTAYVFAVITDLKRALCTFNEYSRGDFRVMGYRHKFMAVQTGSLPQSDTQQELIQKTAEEDSTSTPNLLVRGVLEILVPNEDEFADCLAQGDTLYMANSRVNHSNVHQVEKVFCSY